MKRSEYELLAKTTDWYWWHVAKRRLIQTFLSRLNICPTTDRNKFVLDFGCGVGSNQPLLAQYGQVVGVDISKQALQYARRNSYFSLQQANTDQSFDFGHQFEMIGCFDVLYHRKINDEVVLKNLAKIAKKNAVLVVTDCAHPALWSQHDVNNMARERYSAAELIAKINANGWQVKNWSYLFMSTFPFFMLSRLLNKILGGTADQEYAVPKWLNTLLIYLLKIDAFILKRLRLPFGSSLIIVATKR